MSTVRLQTKVYIHTGEMARQPSEDVRTSYQDANHISATRMPHLAIPVETTIISFTTISLEVVDKEKKDVAGADKSIFLELAASGAQPKEAALSAVMDTSNSATSAGNPYGES